MQLIFLAALIFALLVAVFSLQNAHQVTINFLKWQFEASLGLVILFSLLLGAVSLGCFGLLHQAKDKFTKFRGQGKKQLVEETEKIESSDIEKDVEQAKGNTDGGEEDFPKKLES